MGNRLLKYFLEKFDASAKPLKKPGPVITISRDFGCSAKLVAARLCEILNKKSEGGNSKAEWETINKEIIEESAKELNLNPSKIKEFFNDEQKTIIDEILLAFLESNYKNDFEIKNTISDVVKTFAFQGHKIIIGRGGAALTQNFKNSIHIKLFASPDWRVQKIQDKYNITKEEARKQIIDIDKKRQAIRDFFFKKKEDNSIYDLLINSASYTVDEIAEIITNAMKLKKIG